MTRDCIGYAVPIEFLVYAFLPGVKWAVWSLLSVGVDIMRVYLLFLLDSVLTESFGEEQSWSKYRSSATVPFCLYTLEVAAVVLGVIF